MSATLRLALDGGQPHLANTTFAAPAPSWLGDVPFADALVQRAESRRIGSVRSPAESQARRLERAWRHSTGAAHVVACRSGAVAARLALAALEIGPGDEVICPADSFLLTTAFAAANRA
ncbi:MAG: DegT/DnrJ/EryC1/StrS family aminotransferase, partial [Acidimicrobiales bacterium]